MSENIRIQTPDGDCPAQVFSPSGHGPWPAVIFFMDGFGIRPALEQMAHRLADGGFVVLLPDLFYRGGPYPPIDVKAAFASGDIVKAVNAAFGRPEGAGHPTDNRLAGTDTAAFIACLQARADVAPSGIGAVGYCMGGAMSLTAAGLYPDKIAAAASFHGGALATDSDLSPHRLAAKIRGRLYVGAAERDPFYPPEMAARLESALTDAGVAFLSEVYPGTAHGWTVPDTPPYTPVQAERHWTALLHFLRA